MNILFIEQIDFLGLLFEKILKDQNIFVRSDIHDCLYLLSDLDIELLIIDVDCVDSRFWEELEQIDRCHFKTVFIGLPDNIKSAPFAPNEILEKPLSAGGLKERLLGTSGLD